MRYEITTLARAAEVCASLFEANHAESGMRGHPLRINHDEYRALDAHSPSFAVVAFDGDEAVGLCSVFMALHPHTSELFAQNDTLYVLPSARPRGVGGRLFFRAESEARRRGAVSFLWSAPAASPLARALERRCSATNQQTTFQREL